MSEKGRRTVQSDDRQRRLDRYRHLTRDLGWQPWRAAQEVGIGASTRRQYEQQIKQSEEATDA